MGLRMSTAPHGYLAFFSTQRREPKALDDLLGFSLNVEESSAPNAGQGVKLNGKAAIGSVVVRHLR